MLLQSCRQPAGKKQFFLGNGAHGVVLTAQVLPLIRSRFAHQFDMSVFSVKVTQLHLHHVATADWLKAELA